jgi:hypothetical protein
MKAAMGKSQAAGKSKGKGERGRRAEDEVISRQNR